MNAIDTTVTLRWAITKRCPFRDEIDAGQMVITVGENAPELHNLAGEVSRLTAEPVSHEDFTRAVAMLLPAGSEVVTTWNTGPFDVTVTCRVLPGEAAAE